MNQDFECFPLHQNGPPTDQQKLASERAAALRDEEWQLHNECITFAREALEHYKARGEKHLRIPDLVRILELASRLGRLATGIPTEQIEHALSDYRNDFWTAQFVADLHKVYGQPVDVAAQNLPEPCRSRPAETKSLGRSNNSKTEALTPQSADFEFHDTQS
jgi:hypothetical protein